MAYYSSSFYRADFGEYEYDPTPNYGGSYNFAPDHDQALMAYSSYDFNEPKYIEYDPTPYHGAYDPGLTRSLVAYSISTYSEPKFIEYEPTTYGSSNDLALTQFTISYSTSEFDVPEFLEYDPTPYGGGYDPTLTYGKPLPPSDEICYPRSSSDPNAPPLDGFSHGSVALPNGKDEVDDYSTKPRNGSKPTRDNEEEQQSYAGSGDQLNNGYDNGHGNHLGKPLDSKQGQEREGYICDDNYPWSDYGYGYGYEYNKQVPQTPCACGPGAMDLCESIFGYWPCLSRQNQKSVADEENNSNQWKGTADYLFGSSYPYGDRRDR